MRRGISFGAAVSTVVGIALVSQPLRLGADETTRKGALRVNTEPSGAAVSLGVQGVQSSPAMFSALTPGRHKVTVSKTDYVPATFMVDVVAGDTAQTNLVLESIADWLRDEVKPGAVVWVEELKVGEFTELAEAIAAAPPGARIAIRPGYYRGGLILDRPLKIEGDGNRDHIVIESEDGPCLQMRTSRAVVRGVTLKHKGGGDGRTFAVDIPMGRLGLGQCRVTAVNASCVGIRGKDTAPILQGCVLESRSGSGVVVYDEAGGRIINTEVLRSGLAGIEIHSGGDPLIQETVVHEGMEAGILVHTQGRGQFESCEVSFNRRSGVEIRDGGRPSLRDCDVHDNGGSGILVHKAGQGTISDSRIYANSFAGLEIRDGGSPAVTACDIHHGYQNGVLVHRGGKGSIRTSQVRLNLLAGVEIREGAEPVLQWCKIREGFSGGVYVHTDGKGRLESCEIADNELPGVEIRDGCAPVLTDCTITGGRQAGVLVHMAGKGLFERCQISGNRSNGVEVRDDGAPVLKACTIVENHIYGVKVHRGGQVEVRGSSLVGNARGPWRVEKGCVVTGEGNVTR